MDPAQANGTPQEGDQAPTQPAGQEPQAQTPPAAGQEPQQSGQPQFDPAQIQDPAARAYVERVMADAQQARQEAARYRTERNALRDQGQPQGTQGQQQPPSPAQPDPQTAQALTEAQERAQALEAQVRDLQVGQAARDAARNAQAHNPEAVYRMIQDRITLADDGKPANLDALLAEVRQSDPYLFRRTAGDAGAGQAQGSGPTANDMNDAIRQAVRATRVTMTRGS